MWSAEQATRVAQVVSGYGSAHLDSRLVAGSAVDSGPDPRVGVLVGELPPGGVSQGLGKPRHLRAS
ncbi:MAG TPA: hypothetical protein VGA47_02780 [Candidatus Dormibacteraeota bacterium]